MAGVVIGLSGGVDSAVAAALLKEQGYNVHGLFLDIGVTPAQDAEKTAEKLGIDFISCDISAELEKFVCAPFAEAYLHGRTPSPCTACNPLVKFPALIRAADELGAEFIATGHYARVQKRGGRTALLSALSENDQSYMLAKLPQEILSRLMLPLGEFSSKAAVREKAAALSLEIADKPDSMEICFIPDGDYAAFIERRGIIPPEGDFVSEDGKILGRHRGIHHYTVGQRRRLNIALGERMFVKAIEPETDRVVLAKVGGMGETEIELADVCWVSEDKKTAPFRAGVKVRHSRVMYDATLIPGGSGMKVVFDSPLRRPAPGQMAVFYDGDIVIGSGDIL